MEHEAVFVLAHQRVDALRVALGAQRGHDQRLGFAAGEQGRAVGARQRAGTDLDRPHGAGVAAVDARLAGQDLAAHDLGLDVEHQAVELGRVELVAFGLQVGLHGAAGFAQGLGSGLLAADLVGSAQLFLGQVVDLGDEAFVAGRRLPVPHRLAGVAHQFVDGVDRDLALLMAEHHGAEHHFFRDSCWASDSTISTAASVPATIRSRSDSLRAVWPGLSTYSPLT